MNLDICIDMVYNGEDFIKSMEKVRAAGISSYEFWGWWDKDLDSILEKQKELNMQCITFCTKPITLLEPSKRGEFVAGLKESIEIAKRFDVKLLIGLTGNLISDKSYDEQWDCLVAGLKECASILEENDITLIIEPLNRTDHPGYFLTNSIDAFRLVREVGSKNIKILYDIYHLQIMEGNLIKTITENFDEIGHYHCAGNPGRGNITEGEINYKEVFRAIYNLGYTGHISLEGKISGNKAVGLIKANNLFESSKESNELKGYI